MKRSEPTLAPEMLRLLKAVRVISGRRLEDVAREVGVHGSLVCRFESGERRLGRGQLRRYWSALRPWKIERTQGGRLK